jgi:hypothetical protein
MSEYRHYEFMTIDRPLTKAQLDTVNALSSHIEASPTHALIIYHWGDFKHDPIDVLKKFFDGFLYWANWGSPQLAFRFPCGILPGNLLDGYDLEDFAKLTRYKEYDILDIQFGEMEGPDEWTEYDLGSLIPIRDELMAGDLRSLYIVWLVAQNMMGDYDEDEDDDEEEDEDEEEEDENEDEHDSSVPPIPPGFGALSEAQQEFAALLQVPEELLVAAARHSSAGKLAVSSTDDDIDAWVKLLPPDRSNEYLVRLAQNEPGLSRLFLRELRERNKDKSGATPPIGERVTYATLLAESAAVKAHMEREKREQEEAARHRHLQDIHDHQDDYWHKVNMAAVRASGTSYDEATRLLIELREVAAYFNETQAFQARFRVWVQPHLRRPAFIKRLQAHKFALPEV